MSSYTPMETIEPFLQKDLSSLAEDFLLYDDAANIFDDIEFLTKSNSNEFENLTTAVLLQESLVTVTRAQLKSDHNKNDIIVDSSIMSAAEANDDEAVIESVDLGTVSSQQLYGPSLVDLMDDTFKQKFPISILDKLKKINVVRKTTNSAAVNSQYVWRSKTLQTYEQGGRIGPLDSGKGRKSNWHVPFFGYSTADDLVNSNKETLRVCCFLCSNLTTVQCVQSTMQRHLALKHDYISKALTDQVNLYRTDYTWKHSLKQASLCVSKLLPFSFMDSPEFRAYSHALSSSFHPLTGQMLIQIIARNCYIPSLAWLKQDFKFQLLGLSRSLVITLDIITEVPGKTFVGCSVSYINAKWERESYFLAMMPVDIRHTGTDVARAVELMFRDLFDVPKSCFLAVVGEDSQGVADCAANLGGIAHIPVIAGSVSEAMAFALGQQSNSPVINQTLKTPITRAMNVISYLKKHPKARNTVKILSGTPIDLKAPVKSPSNAVWFATVTLLKSLVMARSAICTALSSPIVEYSASPALTPSDEEWRLYSELAASARPLEIQAEILEDPSDLPLSVVWYMVDWLVFSNESVTRHAVIGVDGSETKLESGQLQAPVRAFREELASSLRQKYLSQALKQSAPALYESMLRATLLDPRTKEFSFFLCAGFAPDDSRRRSSSAQTLFADARNLVLYEMQLDLSELVMLDEQQALLSSLLRPSLVNMIHSVRSTSTQAAAAVSIDAEAKSAAVEEDTLLLMMGVSKKRKMSSGVAVSAIVPGAVELSAEEIAARQRRIQTLCEEELDRYIAVDTPWSPSEIRKVDSLQWWANHEDNFPITAYIARRHLALRSNFCARERVVHVARQLHGKERGSLSPGLVDALVFLYINGILDNTVPDDLGLSGSNTPMSPSTTTKGMDGSGSSSSAAGAGNGGDHALVMNANISGLFSDASVIKESI